MAPVLTHLPGTGDLYFQETKVRGGRVPHNPFVKKKRKLGTRWEEKRYQHEMCTLVHSSGIHCNCCTIARQCQLLHTCEGHTLNNIATCFKWCSFRSKVCSSTLALYVRDRALALSSAVCPRPAAVGEVTRRLRRTYRGRGMRCQNRG